MRKCNHQQTMTICLGAALGLLACGCAEPPQRAATFTALRAYGFGELKVGDDFRDFAFTDDAGKISRLSIVRRRVTILVFPSDPNWPTCADAQQLADLAVHTSGPEIGVEVVSVGHPAGPCPDALAAVADREVPARRLVLVCDPYDRVSRIYGPDAQDKYYVLTNFLRIAAIGELTDLDGLRAATQRIVRDIHDQDQREGLGENGRCAR